MSSPSRRQVLGLLGAAAAAGASGFGVALVLGRQSGDGVSVVGQPAPGRSLASTTSTTVPEAATTTTSTATSLPTVEPYRVVDHEVFVDVKQAGLGVVEALMTHDAEDTVESAVDRALASAVSGIDRSGVIEAARPLHVTGSDSVVRVVYPQLGGLASHADPTTASVMVVAEQILLRDGVLTEVSRTVDVRVRRTEAGWRFEELGDTSGNPVEAPTQLSTEALRVLEHPRILMPDAVRWDIYDGIVDARVLTVMADLADDHGIGVTTCRRGHPINVFGSSSMSAHTVGRAVDIWSIGDRPVVQQRDDNDSVAHRVCEAIAERRTVDRLGAPWAFGGLGGWSWTDPVHLDHIHLGVSA